MIYGQYGIAFFDSNKLVQYIHENDGDFSKEYHGPILKWAGIELVESKNPNELQQKELDVWEQ